MSIKLSHSAKSKYLQCGHSYRLHYIDKLRPVTLSSNLVFGSAIDNALNKMLESKMDRAFKQTPQELLQNTIDEFNRSFEQGQNSNYEIVDLPLNPNLEYGRYDFDSDLLEKDDWKELFKYDSNFFDTKNAVDAKLKDGAEWIDIPEENRMVLNYANWLCCQRRGHLLIQAYQESILPQIKRVIEVQKKVELLDEDGNNLNGVIDFVCELMDGSIAIIDNKTSSTVYAEDSVKGSEQLATYQAILNLFADDPENEWKHHIQKCGYAVMSKKLDKTITKTCQECGNISQGAHKTCDALVESGKAKPKRCNGIWNKVKEFKVNTQFITGTISSDYADSVLENAVTVKSCIELGLFPKNYSACENMFGRKCPYFNKCHGGSDKGLVQTGEKK
jgi:PD-(D/E)XK nuclease superfamily